MVSRFDVKHTMFEQYIHKKKGITVTLGSLCVEEPCYGTSATAIPITDEKQLKYIRITDFDDWGIEVGNEYMTAELYSSKHLLQEGDVLFARTGGTVGKTYYYDGSIGTAIFAGYCIRFRFDVNKVLPKFVYWNTKTDAYKAWVKGVQRPSGQPNINKEEYKSYEIPLPDMSVQAKLVSRMDDALSLRKKKLRQADELLFSLDAVLCDALSITMPKYKDRIACAITLSDLRADNTMGADYYHPERIAIIHMMKESGLKTEKLIELVNFQRDIVFSAECKEGYLGLAGVQSNTGELSGINEDVAGQAFRYQEEDVLYGRLRPYLNKVFFAEKGGICSTEFHVMRVKNKDKLLPAYLAAIMRSGLILSQTRHMMTGNTHPRISNDDVKNLYIPVPNMETQEAIVEVITKNCSNARRLKIEAERDWQKAKTQFEKALLGD